MPLVEGCTVHLKFRDVDDPFNQLNPTMSNVALIDDDFDGPDNRPAPESPVSLTGVLDASGQARVTFTVTMQPGNNYRAGASCLSDAPGQADQAKADLISIHTGVGEWEGYDVPLTWSKMLTVWRKLHLDLDSMGPGTDPSTLTNRNLDTTALEDVHQGHSWAEINAWSGQVDSGRLEGGTLTVTGGGAYNIVDNVDDVGDDSVYVEGSILADEDKPATATDDDATFVPRVADTSLMNAKYQPAYIAIQPHPEESQLNIPFVANLSHDAIPVVNATAPGRNPAFTTAPDFWAVQIVSCYQSTTDVDHDPDRVYHFWTGSDNKDGEGARFGDTPPDDPTIYDNVSVIFLETIRDWADWTQKVGHLFTEWPMEDPGVMERVTVVHEVGHVFLGPAHPPAGIMKGGATDSALQFQAAELLEMRIGIRVSAP